LTEAFINVFPVSVVLTPRHKEKQPAGGFVWVEDPPRDPIVVTFVESRTDVPTPTVTLDGVERRVDLQMIGPWNSTMARFDVFSHQGKDWEIVDLFYDNGYECRAWVSGRG
jgi:hypothetical protein